MYGAGATKGKGKGKGGKGKERAPRKEGGEGHLLEKTRLSVEKFVGTVTAWKGKYGWIKPGEEIDHEKASLHNGDLFVGINDLDDGATSLEAGAPVEFHIFEDSSGLGAEEVVATGPGNPALANKGKGAAKGAAKGGAGWGYKGEASWKGADPWSAAGYGGKGAAKGGAKAGWSLASGQAVYEGAKGVQSGYGGYGGKSADKGKGKGKDKGKAKTGGKGHTLPRTRVSVEKFTGTCKAWKGKYGWIEPAEEIEHEKAAKNKGALWVSMNDIEGATSLEEGATLEFHIFEDSSGLGVEEVVVL